jgi:hypothetical protein
MRNEVSKPISDVQTSYRPLVTEARYQEVVKPAVRSVSSDVEPRRRHDPIEAWRQAREEEVRQERAYATVMPETARGTASTSVASDKSNPFASARVANERRNDSRREAGVPEREPDEIHIHIGRIEVTAVPRAQAPQAVKPAPKAVSLDEYLKRRDARAL